MPNCQIVVHLKCVKHEDALIKNFSLGTTWLNGMLFSVMAPYKFEMKLCDSRIYIVRCHLLSCLYCETKCVYDNKSINGASSNERKLEEDGVPKKMSGARNFLINIWSQVVLLKNVYSKNHYTKLPVTSSNSAKKLVGQDHESINNNKLNKSDELGQMILIFMGHKVVK